MADDGTSGGSWLTYRYRLAGGVADASGTIKAPSFAEAARSLVRNRLAGHLGAEPAYLRLRAAGQEEVLFRVTSRGPGRGPELAVVPPDPDPFHPPLDAEPDRGSAP